MNNQTLKIAFLEIISTLTSKPPALLSESEEFIGFLRNSVLMNLIENTASSYPRIMFLSLTIFFNLIKNFRRHFQEEIPLFIDEIVLKMIDSVNNKSEAKHFLLKVIG